MSSNAINKSSINPASSGQSLSVNSTTNPLITLVVFAYKQQEFIEESVESALAQDYSPLEIILSDDCSPDETFSIMENMASQYKGPHTIKLNRNKKNLGIAGHLNKIPKLASGQFIVMQAGDDMSVPSRVSKIADVWIESNKQALYIHSDVIQIDADGNRLDTIKPVHAEKLNIFSSMISTTAHSIGASEGFSMTLFERFGPLNPDVFHEDRILPFRALLLGECAYIPSPLVFYRTGGISANYSNHSDYDSMYGMGVRIAGRNASDFQQKLNDYLLIDSEPAVIAILKRKKAECELIESFGISKSINWLSTYSAIKNGCSLFFVIKQMIKYTFPKMYLKFVRR